MSTAEDFVAEPDGMEIKAVAAVRWEAIEGALYALDLTPGQRLFLAGLIAHMDSGTKQCNPSEMRMAAELGFNVISITKIRWALKEKGYIDWQTPFGPRGGCFYNFSWSKLLAAKKSSDERAKQALTERKKRSIHSPTAVNEDNDINSHAAVKLFEKRNTIRKAITAVGKSFTAVGKSFTAVGNDIHCRTANSITAVRQSDITLDMSLERPKAEHASEERGGTPKKRKPMSPYAKVEEALEGRPDLLYAFLAMDAEGQSHTSFLLMHPKRGLADAMQYVAEWRR